jgi:hypothetical protein
MYWIFKFNHTLEGFCPGEKSFQYGHWSLVHVMTVIAICTITRLTTERVFRQSGWQSRYLYDTIDNV